MKILSKPPKRIPVSYVTDTPSRMPRPSLGRAQDGRGTRDALRQAQDRLPSQERGFTTYLKYASTTTLSGPCHAEGRTAGRRISIFSMN